MRSLEVRSFLTRYPIISFFSLAFLLGTVTILLVAQGVLPPVLALSSMLLASIAGIMMTAILDGKAGLKLMWKRVLTWRAGTGYWLFALLFLVPVVIIGSSLNPFFNGDPISFSNLNPTFSILPTFIAFFFAAGLGQELGWTCFLTPRLQARFSALVASVVRAVLISLWHLPLLIYSGFQPYALADIPYGFWIAQKGSLTAFAAMTLLLMLPWSIFTTWMFNNTKGSLLLVAALHASEIWLVYLLMTLGISPTNFDNYWGYGLVMALTAIIITSVTGPQNLSRKNERIAYQEMQV